MFEIGNEYSIFEIKEKLDVKEGNQMMKNGKLFVAICLEKGINYIEPNIMLVKDGSLIKKIGRDLSGAKYPINIFIKEQKNSKYEYIGKFDILETKTAPTKIKSILEKFPNINSKEISRLVYLNIV